MSSRINDARIKKTVQNAAIRIKVEYKPPGKEIKFPWRSPRSTYRIFVAESLLVRTRAEAVARVFPILIEKYPNIHALAKSNERDLAEILKSLGLPQRQALLKRGAQFIVEHNRGRVPKTIAELLKVPGLGRYSATAIASFAFKSAEVPADVNILRFLSRLTGLPMTHATKGSRNLWDLLPLLSSLEGGPKSERLLDFSRLVCAPRVPNCGLCPLQRLCFFYLTAAK